MILVDKTNSRMTYILCLSLMIFCPCAFGQNEVVQKHEPSRTSLALSLGINDFHQRDNYLSPFAFGGVNFASKLSFQANTDNNRHRADAFFSKGAINSDVQQRDVTQYVGYLSYSFVHSLNSWEIGDHPFQFLAGGGVSSFVMNTDFFATDEYGDKTYDQSWYWSHSLNLVLSGEYQIDADKNLIVQFTAPLASLVSRPENGHWLSQNNLDVSKSFLKAATHGKMEYLWNNFVLSTDIEYRQSLSDGFDLLATYRFGYVSSDRPASLLSMGAYMNNFLIGISWTF